MDARLQEASRSIHERQYIITAQRTAEQDVAEAAEAVRIELAAAAQDVGVLFASLEELSDVHSGDRDTIKHVQSLVAVSGLLPMEKRKKRAGLRCAETKAGQGISLMP